MKRKIDIEKLVQWAMRDELPKGQAVSASPWDMLSQYAQLGCRVQTGGYAGDGLGFTPGAPHEDALIVADAIGRLDTAGRFADDVEASAMFGDLLPIAGDAVASIAMAVFNPQSLVISKATMGTRPKWQFELPTPYQMFREFGDPVGAVRKRPLVYGVDADGDLVEILPNRGRAVARDGFYSYAYSPRSPLQWGDPSMISIGHARAEYVFWHDALTTLARDLIGRLAEWDAQPPALAAMPWITGQTPVSRVLGVADVVATPIGLPLAPRRDPSSRPIAGPRKSSVRFVPPDSYAAMPTMKIVAAVA